MQNLSPIDRLIREGNISAARAELKRVAPGKIPRAWRPTVAQLASRAGLSPMGIRLLRPLVRPDDSVVQATDEEKSEYAYCLVRIGSADEALAILATVNESHYPAARFYAAAARLNRWDYAGAIPLLERYVRSHGVTPYQRLVGKVNLAAALVAERRGRQASYLLRDLVYETGVQKLWLLHANVLQFAACNLLFQKKFAEARAYLDQAKTELAASGLIDEFFVRKWMAILDCVEAKQPAGLLAFREEARKRGHWETVRDCDRFLCVSGKDEALLRRLYFGTPYPEYRRWLISDFPGSVELESQFVSGEGPATLDVTDGVALSTGESLARGRSLHRMLAALASDSYRPFHAATLFERVFPGECLNPATSFPRLHQAKRLLNRWLESQSLPLAVEVENGAWRLQASGPVGLRIAREAAAPDETSERLQRLRLAWPSEMFSAEEAAKALALSTRTAHRVLEAAIAGGRLEKIGRTAKARYRFL